MCIPDWYILARWRKDARQSVSPIYRSHATTDPKLVNVINRRRYINRCASIIQHYGDRTKSWLIFERHHAALEHNLTQLSSDDEDLSALISTGSRVDAIQGLLQNVLSCKCRPFLVFWK